MALRIVFCGTPEFAIPCFHDLRREPEFEMVGVVTQPDRPSGRGQHIHRSAIKDAALAAGLPIYQPEKIKSDEAYRYFERLRPDVVVIVAYGQIIPARLIEIPRLGWINLHASLLPKYRGAAPINWAILHGEEVTGVTTMQIDAGLDTGPTLLKQAIHIGKDETAPELAARLAAQGGRLMVETLRQLSRGEIALTPQDPREASFAPPLQKENGRIDWSLSRVHIYNQIRALEPWPGAFTTFREKKAQIWAKPTELGAADRTPSADNLPPGTIEALPAAVIVRCARGEALELEFVRIEGRKRVTAREFVNGARLGPGEAFGD